MNGFLGDPYACPVCVAIGDASSHWLEGLRWAADDVAAGCLWLFAPCCKRHVCEAARLGRPDLVARVASFALSGLAEQARQQVAGIVRELALAEQPKPVWYRPRRRRREASAAGIQPGKRFILRCRGCEAEAIALERASGTFLDLMRHARYRELLARGHRVRALDSLIPQVSATSGPHPASGAAGHRASISWSFACGPPGNLAEGLVEPRW